MENNKPSAKPPKEIPKKELKFAAIAGDLKEFMKELKKLRDENTIVKEHISSQLIQIPNPNYMKGITDGQPQVVTNILFSALVEFEDK